MKRFSSWIVGLLLCGVLVTVALGAELAVVENYYYNNITTATTTYVKTSGGILAGVLVNGGTMGSITISDATASFSGSTIATIASPYAGQVIPLGVQCANGIKVVTAAATNLTVVYK